MMDTGRNDMDTERIIEKIRKCLALSGSSNAHEAAIALRQAQALMARHGINDNDLLAAEAREARTQAGVKRRPTGHEATLADTVAKAFQCDLFFAQGRRDKGEWVFVGVGGRETIAQYAFDVLARQLRMARADYLKTACTRLRSAASKTRRADIFASAWVEAVQDKVMLFARSESDDAAIAAYKEKHYALTTRTLRKPDPLKSQGDIHAAVHGLRQGAAAALHQAVDPAQQALALAAS